MEKQGTKQITVGFRVRDNEGMYVALRYFALRKRAHGSRT
jgi:hypothetical protein